jgi:type IV pilus assembly protein PilV
MISRSAASCARGFSLIEVLVALVVVSVGLLGIAKMQALAYASTGVASKRSLAAIEASSLASSMHANRTYWATGAGAVTVTVNKTVITSTDPALVAVTDCTTAGSAPCVPSAVAAYDVQSWVTGLAALLTNDQASIVCATAAVPVTCVITITWSENAVAVNSQEAAAATAALAAGTPAALQLPSYTLYVEP